MALIVTTEEDLVRMIGDAVSRALAEFKPAPAREARYVTVAEAAKKLNVAPLTIYRGVKAGKIPHKMIGSLIKIPSSFLEQ